MFDDEPETWLPEGHIARGALEATAHQTFDLAQAMLAGTGLEQLGELRADGGMTKNELLMQFQADVLGSPVVSRRGGEGSIGRSA